MRINIPKSWLIGIFLQPVVVVTGIMAQTACNKDGGDEVIFDNACNKENFLAAFKDIFNDNLLKPADCTNTIEEELAALLGVSAGNSDDGIKAACKAAQDTKQEM